MRFYVLPIALFSLTLAMLCANGLAKTSAPGIPPLPSAFQGKEIRVAVLTGIPPVGFTDAHGKPTGVGPDEVRALAKITGYPFKPVVAAWEIALPGLASGRFQAVQGASITQERMKIYDMVHDFNESAGFIVRKDSPAIGNSLARLCGLKVGDVAGDILIPLIQSTSKKLCVAKGRSSIQLSTYPRLSDALLALKAGRIDTVTQAMTALGWAVKKQPSEWKITGPRYASNAISFATVKGSGLAAVMAAGLNQLIKNGTYGAILRKYGLSANAVRRVTVNPKVARVR